MKLKFRAEPKDVVIFIIFCVMLLYVVAVVELNVISFASNSTFNGLNPLPAFSPDLFAPTMVFFIASLIAIIASVSNYFWERESGFGFASGKKDKGGYSRWATDKEMAKELKKIDPSSSEIPYAGVPLINNKKGVWVDNGEYHSLIIGATGSGKTEMVVQPLVSVLARKGESMIITDPKGEIYERNGELLKEKGYNIVVLNFRSPQQGNAWNPLDVPYYYYTNGNQDKAVELLEDLGTNIVHDEKTDDPFWQNTGGDFFTGLALGLFEDAKKEEINLNSINAMATAAEEKFAGTKLLNAYFNFKDKSGSAYVNVNSTINAPNETKGSILSVFRQKIKIFASRENLSEMLSYSDFDMRDIGKKKTAVFIILQDEKKTYHALGTIFLKQCYETLIDVAQENGGKLKYRTNFILDEFANMPALKDISTMITAARSRQIRLNFIIQNFAQLEDVYGKQTAETIKGNCGNIIYLISSELAALEEISKLCGEKESKKDAKTASTPLVTVSDLQRLPQWTQIIIRMRKMPYKTKAIPYFQMDKEGKWGKHYPKAVLPTRAKQEVKIFDIKEFTETKHKSKMEELFGSAGTGNPIMDSPMGNNLFGGVSQAASGPSMQSMVGNLFDRTPANRSEMPASSNRKGGFDLDELTKRIDAKLAEIEAEEKQEALKANAQKEEAIRSSNDSAKLAQESQSITDKVVDSTSPFASVVRQELEKKKEVKNVNIPDTEIIDDNNRKEEFIEIERPIPENSKPKVETKINVATLSDNGNVVVEEESMLPEIDEVADENFVTDDQFFDDFFSEDE